MLTRPLGDGHVGSVGLGCAPISVRPDPDEARGLTTMVAALDAGVTLFDTADIYNPPGKGAGHSEELVRKALSLWSGERDGVTIATKGGKYWSPNGDVIVDGRPAYLRDACHASLRRLRLDAIPLYFLHEPDRRVPFAESVGALADLQSEGKIRLLGVSNVSLEQIDVAQGIARVAAVQNQYSPAFRDSQPQLDRCTEAKIAFLPWAPLKGIGGADSLNPVARRFALLAGNLEVSVHRLAIAWALAQSPAMVPIPGATRPETIRDDVEAQAMHLEDEHMAWLNGEGTAPPRSGRRRT